MDGGGAVGVAHHVAQYIRLNASFPLVKPLIPLPLPQGVPNHPGAVEGALIASQPAIREKREGLNGPRRMDSGVKKVVTSGESLPVGAFQGIGRQAVGSYPPCVGTGQ
jgi:hypothetical protein